MTTPDPARIARTQQLLAQGLAKMRAGYLALDSESRRNALVRAQQMAASTDFAEGDIRAAILVKAIEAWDRGEEYAPSPEDITPP